MSETADQPDKPSRAAETTEAKLRRRLIAIAGINFLVLLTILTLADTFGQSSGFHASEFIFGSLLGAFLIIVGVEGASKVYNLVKK